MVVRVPDGKRKEFQDALDGLPGASPNVPDHAETLETVGDDSRICWYATWATEHAARAFLTSEAYRALRGAARVMGELESIEFGRGEPIA
jgi:hypothetical protein